MGRFCFWLMDESEALSKRRRHIPGVKNIKKNEPWHSPIMS